MEGEPEHRTGAAPRPPAPRATGAGAASAYLGAGLQFSLAILLGVYLGQWLDRRFGTEPWWLLAGVFLGAGAGFLGLYRKLMAGLRQDEDRRQRLP